MAIQKNIEASIKTLETQVDQLAKQLIDIPNDTFSDNTQTNPKEHCSLFEVDQNIIVKDMEEEAEEPEPKESQDENY